MKDYLGILLTVIAWSLKHFVLENAVAGFSLVQHFEWNMSMTKKPILGILDESMQHFTIGNAVAG
jgi:hypothetical protein